MKTRTVLLILTFLSVAGCASYSAKPLADRANLPREVPHLVIASAQLPFPQMAMHRFNPDDGLDIVEVAVLAVVNNPELKLARDDAQVAQAQAFAAGLLPDPQLSATQDVPDAGQPGTTSGHNFGLSFDIRSLFTRSTTKAAADAQRRTVDLNLLWMEWQVIGQARLLFVRDLEQRDLLRVLEDNQKLFQSRYSLAQQQLLSGNATLEPVSAYLAALQQVNRQINELRRQMNQTHYDLAKLLGLAPETDLHLVGASDLPPFDPLAVRKELPLLPKLRPDLLALQAGYQSQEFRVRKAILDQFPALSVGINRASDTSGVNTRGFGISLSLPLFDGNRGNIAIERATRQRLYDEFQVRLNGATSGIEQLLADQVLLEGQLGGVRIELTNLRTLVAHAETAFGVGNMNALDYANLRAGLLAKEAEAISLELALQEQRIALLVLTGSELTGQKGAIQ